MNRFVLGLLRSPGRRLIGGRVCALRFRGRTTSRVIELPVEYVRAGGRLVVLAGHGERKTWWRNFRTVRQVDVLLNGRWLAATGTALGAGAAGRSAAVARYRATHTHVRADTTDPVVVIDLEHSEPDRASGLWTHWFRNVTVGECAGFAMPAAVGAVTAHAVGAVSVPLLVLAGAVEGALLGWFQARVLRSVVDGFPVARWTAVTATATALAWAIGLTPSLAGSWLSGLPLWALVPLVAVGSVVLLVSIGTAQWTVLRGLVPDAGRWVWGTALAWLVAIGVFVAVTTPLWQPGQDVATIVLIGVLGGLLMATTVAALTGLLVVRVVDGSHGRTGTLTPASAARATRPPGPSGPHAESGGRST
jgi:hypothetical protein